MTSMPHVPPGGSVPPEAVPGTQDRFAQVPRTAQPGQLVLLVTEKGKRYLLRLQPGVVFHTHLGVIPHDELIGQPLGATVFSAKGHPLLMLEPSLPDLMKRIKRTTQIVYPKDAARIVQLLNLRAGRTVIEAGTGSGGLTIALAWAVAPTGRVYSYEARPEHQRTARLNLERVGLLDYVSLIERSVEDGFLQQGVDALFLDVRTPWRYLEQVRQALRPGGFFASLVPTTNQVSDLLTALEQQGFADIRVEEILLRRYKPVPDRLRPEDTMIGHTGFIISARPVIDPEDATRWLSEERKRYMARQELAARIAAEEARRAARSTAGEENAPEDVSAADIDHPSSHEPDTD